MIEGGEIADLPPPIDAVLMAPGYSLPRLLSHATSR